MHTSRRSKRTGHRSCLYVTGHASQAGDTQQVTYQCQKVTNYRSKLIGHRSYVTCLCILITSYRFKFACHNLYVTGYMWMSYCIDSKAMYIGHRFKRTNHMPLDWVTC